MEQEKISPDLGRSEVEEGPLAVLPRQDGEDDQL